MVQCNGEELCKDCWTPIQCSVPTAVGADIQVLAAMFAAKSLPKYFDRVHCLSLNAGQEQSNGSIVLSSSMQRSSTLQPDPLFAVDLCFTRDRTLGRREKENGMKGGFGHSSFSRSVFEPSP